MVKVGAACMIVKHELYEVNAAILLCEEELLLLVKHPSHGRKWLCAVYRLFAEPLPVTLVEDQYLFVLSCL